jgi:hypothetical protein
VPFSQETKTVTSKNEIELGARGDIDGRKSRYSGLRRHKAPFI